MLSGLCHAYIGCSEDVWTESRSVRVDFKQRRIQPGLHGLEIAACIGDQSAPIQQRRLSSHFEASTLMQFLITSSLCLQSLTKATVMPTASNLWNVYPSCANDSQYSAIVAFFCWT